MKSCPAYENELMDCAALAKVPPAYVSAHLESCAACRSVLQELQAAALLQSRLAARLPEPQRPAALDKLFLQAVVRPAPVWRKPALAFAFVVVAVAGGLVLALMHGGKSSSPNLARSSAVPEIVESRTASTTLPTWQALRGLAQADTLKLPAMDRPSGVIAGVYRVKDAYNASN
jgi:hypothetical protein